MVDGLKETGKAMVFLLAAAILVLFLPLVILAWIFAPCLCRVIGHRPQLVTVPSGEWVQTGTTWRHVGGKLMGERMEVPVEKFVPSGLPDAHVVRCRFCETEFPS